MAHAAEKCEIASEQGGPDFQSGRKCHKINVRPD